jgi:hypothetical protein
MPRGGTRSFRCSSWGRRCGVCRVRRAHRVRRAPHNAQHCAGCAGLRRSRRYERPHSPQTSARGVSRRVSDCGFTAVRRTTMRLLIAWNPCRVKIDAIGSGCRNHERRPLGAVLLEGPTLVSGRRVPVCMDDPPPRQVVPIVCHYLADGPRRSRANTRGDFTVRHHTARGDGIDNAEYPLGELWW